jgi:hypothetical protein
MTNTQSAIARLRAARERWVIFESSMIPVEAEIARALPALLECAEALVKSEDILRRAEIDSELDALCVIRAALQALAEGG